MTGVDLSSFLQASVAGVPLVFVIIGVVAWFKEFRRKDGTRLFQGNALLLISMFVGLVIGGVYMVTQQRPPEGDWWTGLGYWFAVAVYGISLGLVASGLYEMTRGIIEKTFGGLFRGVVIDLLEAEREVPRGEK